MANLLRQMWRSTRCWFSGHVEPAPDVWHLGGIFEDPSGTWCAFERPCNRCGFVLSMKWGMDPAVDPAVARIARREGAPTAYPSEGTPE